MKAKLTNTYVRFVAMLALATVGVLVFTAVASASRHI